MKKRLFPLIPVLLIALVTTAAVAQPGSMLRITLTTGSDDLRGSNTSFVKINRTNGTSSPEFELGGGFGQNSAVEKEVPLPGTFDLSEIRSITIRHDGSPRGPFDTYDNWDLQSVSVALVSDEGNGDMNIYNSANDRNRNRFLQRFTGDRRTITLIRQRVVQ